MTAISWKNPVNGDWNIATNWSTEHRSNLWGRRHHFSTRLLHCYDYQRRSGEFTDL